MPLYHSLVTSCTVDDPHPQNAYYSYFETAWSPGIPAGSVCSRDNMAVSKRQQLFSQQLTGVQRDTDTLLVLGGMRCTVRRFST